MNGLLVLQTYARNLSWAFVNRCFLTDVLASCCLFLSKNTLIENMTCPFAIKWVSGHCSARKKPSISSVFIVEQPPLSINIHLMWLKQKCLQMKWCFQFSFTLSLVTFTNSRPLLLTSDQTECTFSLNTITDVSGFKQCCKHLEQC